MSSRNVGSQGKMAEVIEPTFHKVVDGINGSEGPVFTRDGRFFCVAPEVFTKEGTLWYATPGAAPGDPGAIYQKTRLTALEVDGNWGMPSGLQSDRENNLWVADMTLGILKVTLDGNIKQIAKVDDQGETMQGCNDCMFDYEGNLWVTGPGGDIAPNPFRVSVQEAFGCVYCLTTTGKVIKAATGFLVSNGLAVKHKDGKPYLLIVAETMTQSLWAFDIIGPGQVTNRRLWGKLPASPNAVGPDGMDFDEVGNLLVANMGEGHLEIFGPNGGAPQTRIKLPFDKPSNLHFKQNSNICYVTEHTNNALWWFEWKHKGRKEYCDL